MANKMFELEWKNGNARKVYIKGTGYSIQIGKYRDLDDYEKTIKLKPTWQGKWYVDDAHTKVKLFNTEKQASIYFFRLIKRIYQTKQLN